MTKGISYTRFSTPEQSKGDSYRRQIEACEEYCKQHSIELIDAFHDEGISAFKGKNSDEGALRQIIQNSKNGDYPKGTVLIVESLDRISRDTINKQLQLFLEILNSGMDIVTLSDGCRRYSGDKLELVELVISLTIMSRAHEESLMKSKRLGEAWKNKKKQAREGKILTKNRPAWLDVEDDEFVPNGERVKVIQDIFKMAVDEDMGRYAICKRLDENNVPTFGKPKKNSRGIWGASYVGTLLKDKRLIGQYQPMTKDEDGKKIPHGEPIKDYYPAILEEDIFYQSVNKVGKRQKLNNGRKPTRKSANIFRGLCYCHECGKTLNYKQNVVNDEWTYLKCSVQCEASRSIHYDATELLILAMLPTIDIGNYEGENRERMKRNDVREGRISDLNTELCILKHKFKDSKSPTILEMIEENETEINSLKGEIEELLEVDTNWMDYLMTKDKMTDEWRENTRGRLSSIIKRFHAKRMKDGVGVKMELLTGEVMYGWLSRDTWGFIDEKGKVKGMDNLELWVDEFLSRDVMQRTGVKQINPFQKPA